MIVVKVGGSLYDHPRLGPGLLAWLGRYDGEAVLLVPGGGPFADAVRRFDAVHGLGEVRAHWLAVRSLDVTADLLSAFSEGWAKVSVFPDGLLIYDGWARFILDALPFLMNDTGPESLPHTWDVSSDSIAARAAVAAGAEKLVLLKSIDIPPGTPWATAAANGWVDAYFPKAVEGVSFPVEVVNFRRYLDEYSGALPARSASDG